MTDQIVHCSRCRFRPDTDRPRTDACPDFDISGRGRRFMPTQTLEYTRPHICE